MIRLQHVITVTAAAAIAILLLWLERLYGGALILNGIAFTADSATVTGAWFISTLTSPTAAIAVCAVGGLVASYEHRAKLWWLFAALLAVAAALSTFLKELIMLPRPDHALLPLSSYGFPSTHATVATVALVVLSWFIYHHHQRMPRLSVLAVTLGWFSVCISRIALSVHSVSDVLAGIMLGASVGVMAIAFAPRLFAYYDISLTPPQQTTGI